MPGSVILVTGGAGYIGSHACKALAARGDRPVVFDNLSFGHEAAVKWGPFERGDLDDPARIDEAIARHKPESVLHFAARALVGESVEDPGKYYRNNVGGTLNLLEAMRRHNVARIVFSSTCAVYGHPRTENLAEDHPKDPINPYGATKLAVERMLEDFEAAYGIRSAALRYFNAAGADPAGEIGEDHTPETHLIPLALDAALGRRDGLGIFGTDYPTPDGTCVRDYVHVSDLADAHLRALDFLGARNESLRLNLGNERGYSVREVIDTARKITGREIKIREVPRRPGDPPRLVADASRAHEALGWRPRFGDLETIVRHAWAWHARRFGHKA